MPDRGKVIGELETLTMCGRYDALVVCVARDAIALLREQKPRVLTLDELRALPVGAVVWYEQRALYQTYIMPMVVTADGHIGNWALGVCMDVIGQDDRCWSARPTDEQREATPWRV